MENRQAAHGQQTAGRQLIDAMEQRAAAYGLFARLYARELDEPLLADLAKATAQEHDDPDENRAAMASYLAENADDPATMRQELAVDFAQLFLIREAHETAAPYPFESAYASSEGILTSDARADFKHRYRSFGLVTSEQWNVGEDHIALELQYLQYLAQSVRNALVAGDDQTADAAFDESLAFLRDHVRKWVPVFCQRVGNRAKTAFYRGLAGALASYVEQDAAFLADLWEDEPPRQ